MAHHHIFVAQAPLYARGRPGTSAFVPIASTS
jgi:hypothetical protein